MENKCANCKHWNTPLHELPPDPTVKYCDRITHDVDGRYHLQIFDGASLAVLMQLWEEDEKLNKEKVVIQTQWKYRGEARLVTKEDFGCNLFEEKQDEIEN